MTVKSFDPLAQASAVSVTFSQLSLEQAPAQRPEIIAVLGSYQTNKVVSNNVPVLLDGTAEDAYIKFGASPLYYAATKLFPKNGTGARVPVYAVPVPTDGSAAAAVETITFSMTGAGATKSFVGTLLFNELPFASAADAVGKIATNAQLNPARAPRGTKLDGFNQLGIQFSVPKNTTDEELAAIVKAVIDENPDFPYSATVAAEVLTLTAKWKGTSSNLTLSVTADGEDIGDADVGMDATIANVSEGIDASDLTDALGNLTESYNITRVVNQFDTDTNLDRVQQWGEGLRDSLVSQYAISYSGREQIGAGESAEVKSSLTGSTTDVESDYTDWTGISDPTFGGFKITVDGIEHSIDDLDFGTAFDMDNIAGIIQSEMDAEGIGATVTCAWDDTEGRFVLTTSTSGADLSFLADNPSVEFSINDMMGCAATSEGAVLVTASEASENYYVDVAAMKAVGDARRDDAVNSLIYGTYGDLRELTYSQRDTLLKAGISNIEIRSGVPTLMDSVTLYHPEGVSSPLFQFDENIAKIGNIAYDQRAYFDGEEWKNKIIVSVESKTTNPDAVDIDDIAAAFFSRAEMYEKVAWIARASFWKENSEYVIDDINSRRVNANNKGELTSTLALLDITNFLGFLYGESA